MVRVVVMSIIWFSAGSSSIVAAGGASFIWPAATPGSRFLPAADSNATSSALAARCRAASDRLPAGNRRSAGRDRAAPVARREAKVEPQVGGADVVGLLDDQVPTLVKARRRARESEGDEQAEQGEHRAIDRAGTGLRAFGIVGASANANPSADFEQRTMPTNRTKVISEAKAV
jgi:hypothetical protein